MLKNTRLFEDTASTLQRLKYNGIYTGIVTTKYHYRIDETLNLHGISHLEGLLLAIGSLNSKMNDVLYIGDSLVDAKTALAANVDFAAVTTGTTNEKEFLQYPCIKVLNNLSELKELIKI